MAAGFGVSFVSFLGGNYGLFGITKADAPMYGSLAMLASLGVVALVTVLAPAPVAAKDRSGFCGTEQSEQSH